MPTKRLARRSRSAVLWGLAGIIGLQLGLAVAVERWYMEVRDPEYANRLTLLRARMAEEPGMPLLLVLGSSRTSNGFRPDVLSLNPPAGEAAPLVFNFGITGSGPVHEFMYLRRLLAEGVRPRWLVLEVLPVQLYQESLEATTAFERLAWSDLAVLEPFSEDAARLRLRWWRTRLQPWSSYRFHLLNQHAAAWLPRSIWRFRWWKTLDRTGWAPFPRATVADYEKRSWTEESRLQYAPLLRSERIIPAQERALTELLTLCRREGIEPILLLMPESSAFRGWSTTGSRKALDECLARLEARYQVAGIDARDWVGDDDFYDSQHLLPGGAARFTRRLGREVLQPLVDGQAGTGFARRTARAAP